MNKKQIIGIVIFVLIVLGVIGYKLFKPREVKIPFA